MDAALSIQIERGRNLMRVEISRQEEELEEQQTRGPHGGSTAKPRQQEFTYDELNLKQQERARKYCESKNQTRRSPIATLLAWFGIRSSFSLLWSGHGGSILSLVSGCSFTTEAESNWLRSNYGNRLSSLFQRAYHRRAFFSVRLHSAFRLRPRSRGWRLCRTGKQTRNLGRVCRIIDSSSINECAAFNPPQQNPQAAAFRSRHEFWSERNPMPR